MKLEGLLIAGYLYTDACNVELVMGTLEGIHDLALESPYLQVSEQVTREVTQDEDMNYFIVKPNEEALKNGFKSKVDVHMFLIESELERLMRENKEDLGMLYCRLSKEHTNAIEDVLVETEKILRGDLDVQGGEVSSNFVFY